MVLIVGDISNLRSSEVKLMFREAFHDATADAFKSKQKVTLAYMGEELALEADNRTWGWACGRVGVSSKSPTALCSSSVHEASHQEYFKSFVQ